MAGKRESWKVRSSRGAPQEWELLQEANLVFHQLDRPTILPYVGRYQDQEAA